VKAISRSRTPSCIPEKLGRVCNFHLDSVVLLGHCWGTVLALEYVLRYAERVSRLILMNPGPAFADDYKQVRKEWLERRTDDMDRRKAISASAAYKDGDPDAVTAYYRIHFKPALARPEDFEKVIARLRSSFTKEGILKGESSREPADERNMVLARVRPAPQAQEP